MPPRSLNTYIFMIAHDEDAIEDVKLAEQPIDKVINNKWFDLQGHRYDTNTTLRPGIYIHNGKKIVIK